MIAFIFALSRWGTNIGYSPFFICDLMILGSLVGSLRLFRARELEGLPSKTRGTIPSLFVAFYLVFIARWLVSFISATPVIQILRDGMPYAYGILVFMVARSLSARDPSSRGATLKVLRWALTIHLLWVAAVLSLGLSKGLSGIPLLQAPAFEVRPDIDAALIAVAAGLNLRQLILGQRRMWNVAGIILAIVTVSLGMSTRAGQLSLAAALIASFALTFPSVSNRRTRLLLVLILPMIVIVALTLLPMTNGGQRLLATVLPSMDSTSVHIQNARGTEQARRLVWTGVINWVNEDPSRVLFGSGFGNNFLEQSGTAEYLEGTTYTNVRSPHNWFVGTYARLGAPGALLALAWIGQLSWTIVRSRTKVSRDDLLVLSVLVFICILTIATLGVVLEAPFGAIPFFWCCGLLVTDCCPTRNDSRNTTQRRQRSSA